MHHSRLCSILIDCRAELIEPATHFWSRALGREVKEVGPRYTSLATPEGELTVDLQRVSGPSGVHLDIETDDLEAEVRRLEALGARRKRKVRRWWVMEAPSGHTFCVVKAFSPEFAARAKPWSEAVTEGNCAE